MVVSPGEYWFTSPGSEEVCGLYLIGQPDQLIQLHFTHFNIDCSPLSVLEVSDDVRMVAGQGEWERGSFWDWK